MPLQLSTVQINTNLPHDKCPTLVKDRIGRVHFVSDPAAAPSCETAPNNACNNNSNKPGAPPSNMFNRALDHRGTQQQLLQRRKAECGDYNSRLTLLKGNKRATAGGRHSQWVMDEKERQLATSTSPSQMGAPGGQPPAVTTGDSQIPGSTPDPAHPSGSDLDTTNETSATAGEGGVGSTAVAVEKMNNYKSSSNNNEDHHHHNNSSSNKSSSQPSKWIPRKREVQQVKQQQRKDQRAKEYKHSRYEDSPPESPPCGWDRCPAGNQSEDLGFRDHFLDGSWMLNSQLSESVDAGKKPYCLADSLMKKISSSSLLHNTSLRRRYDCHHHDEEAEEEDMIASAAGGLNLRDDEPKKPQAVRSSRYCVSDQTSAARGGIAALRGSENRFPNIEVLGVESDVSSEGEFCSDGLQSCCRSSRLGSSSSSATTGWLSSQEFSRYVSRETTDDDVAAAAATAPAATRIVTKLGGRGVFKNSSKKSDHLTLQSRFVPTSLLAKESEKKSQTEDDTLMFDLHDDRFFPGHLSEKKKDGTGLELDAMTNDIFSTMQAKGIGDSFDFGSDPDISGEFQLDSSPRETALQMTNESSEDFSTFKLRTVCAARGPTECGVLSKSGEAVDQHQPLRAADDRPPNHDHDGRPIKSNVRPDEDLDLLYDPTLDCYYDPKTNRYYELK